MDSNEILKTIKNEPGPINFPIIKGNTAPDSLLQQIKDLEKNGLLEGVYEKRDKESGKLLNIQVGNITQKGINSIK